VDLSDFKTLSTQAVVHELTGPDAFSKNDFENPNIVRPSQKIIQLAGKVFDIELQRLSLTILEIKIE
jgi:alpha-L-arabinofuranosidase